MWHENFAVVLISINIGIRSTEANVCGSQRLKFHLGTNTLKPSTVKETAYSWLSTDDVKQSSLDN